MSGHVHRSKLITTALLGLVLSGSASAQTWMRRYADDDGAWLISVATWGTDEFIATGFSSPEDRFEPRGLLQRFDRLGDTITTDRFDSDDRFFMNDLIAFHSGLGLAVGSEGGQPWYGTIDIATCTSTSEVTLSSASGSFEAVARTDDGGVVMTGRIDGGADDYDLLVARFDASLNLLWKRRFGGLGVDEGHSIVATPGGCVIAGRTDSFGLGMQRLWLLALHDDGLIDWSTVYVDHDISVQYRPALARSSLGNMTVAYGRGRAIHLTSTGIPLWRYQYDLGDNLVRSICATEDLGFVISGQTGPLESADAWLMRIAANGVVQWELAFDYGGAETFSEVIPARSGAFLAVGSTSSSRDEITVARISARGNIADPCSAVEEVTSTWLELSIGTVDVAPLSKSIDDGAETNIRGTALFLTASDVCRNDSQMQIEPFGQGLAGTGGYIPELVGESGWCDGDDTRIEIRRGLGRASGLLVIGSNEIDAPFLGGRLYVDPSPPSLVIPIRLNGSHGNPGGGGLVLPVGEDFSAFIGFDLFAQGMIFDPVAPVGVSMTNGAQLRIF